MQKCFFTWIDPIFEFTNKQDGLTLDNCGIMANKYKIDDDIRNLRDLWNKKKNYNCNKVIRDSRNQTKNNKNERYNKEYCRRKNTISLQILLNTYADIMNKHI